MEPEAEVELPPTRPPRPRRRGRGRVRLALARALLAALWSLVGLVALLLSLAYHLQLPFAGAVAIEAIAAALDGSIQGTIQVGELANVGYEKLVARSVIIRDPQGREVIRAEELVVVPDLAALWHGTIRLSTARVRNGRVRLYVSDTGYGVSIADTFLPIESGDGTGGGGGGGPHVVIDGIVLDDVLVVGDVPSYEDLRVEDLRAEGRVEVRDAEVLVQVYDGHGMMTGPYPGRTSIDQIVGRVDSVMSRGIEFFARAHRGEDRVRARFRLTVPEEDATPEMILEASVAPVRMSTLAEMEIAPGLDNLTGTFRGHGRLEGPVDDLRLRADLTSEAGRAHVRGRFAEEQPIELEAWTQDVLRLSELVPAAPPANVAGRVRLRLDETTRALHADVLPVTIVGVAIPAFALDGVLEDEALRIDSVTSPHLGGQVEGSGRVGFDGSLDVAVRARIPEISRDPNVRRLAPDARGALTADLHIEADPGIEDLRGEGRVGLRRARYGSLRAERLDVSGRVSGRGPAPELHLRGDADGLVVGELTLGHAEVSIDGGGPAGYALRAESRDAASHTRFALRGRARSTHDALSLETESLLADLGDGRPWEGRLSLSFSPERSVTLSPLVLRRGSELIEVEGTYRFRGPDQISARASGVDLAGLRPLSPTALEGLEGIVDGQLLVEGDLDRDPRGRLSLHVRDGALRRVRGLTGHVDLTLGADGIDTDVELSLGDAGQISLRGPIAIEPASLLRDPTHIAERAILDGLTGSARSLDLGLLTQLGLVDALPVSGRLSTELSLAGTGSEPGLRDATVILDEIALEGWDPLRAKARVSLGEGRLVIQHAWVADVAGELAQMQADLPLSLDDLPRDLPEAWAALHRGAWSASARLPGRRVDTWPRPLRDLIPVEGLRVSASLTADGDERGPRARIAAVGQFVEAATEDACGADLRPVFTLDGALDGEVVTADIRGFVGDGSARIEANAYAQLPIDRWLRHGVSDFPPTELLARVRGADLADVPYLCRYGRGPLNASVTAKDLLTGQSVIGAVIDLPRLSLWEQAGDQGEPRLSTEYRVHVRAGSSPEGDALTGCVILGEAGTPTTPGVACREVDGALEGELLGRVRVPVTWTEGELLPAYVDGSTITSWSDLRGVHVEPLLAFVPGVVAGDGVMRGQVEIRGPWESMQLAGELDLTEGHVQIEGLGQHLHDISGRLELYGDEVIFPSDRPLAARDSGGRAQLQGVVGFEGIVPRRLDLVLTARDFPVRREGMVLASLTGEATLGGRIRDDGIGSTIQTRNFSVRLPEQTAGSLQSLEDHPDILVVGSERAEGGGERREGYPITIRVDARDPFWVRRNDFAAQISSDLTAVYEDPELRVRGLATILRGTFEIFGKRFELQRGGSLTFLGSADLDPLVNIDARYEIPGRTGADVTVLVRGTLTHPEIEFRSSETSDRAEIIALLVSGGRREVGTAEQEASQQAASFLAGLTAGILTLGLREEFGDIIPVLAIESEGAGGTRVRAGFNANDLIPDFLREVITGAYIEGFITAAQDTNAAGGSSGAGGVGGGVTVEFTFPYNFLMRGTYVPVDNGSLDVLFEP